MSSRAASGDLSCDLREVDTLDLTEAWRELLERTYLIPFDVRPSPRPGDTFDARTWRYQLGELTLVRTLHGAGLGRRGPDEIAASDDDVLGILVLRRGKIGLDFSGRSATLSAGELVMWDGSRCGGFATSGTVDNHTLVVPRERLRGAVPNYDAMIGVPLPAGHPAARLMANFMASVLPVLGDLDAGSREAVADAAVELARAVIAPSCARDELQPTAALTTIVRRYIDEHLTDPTLSPTSIANANAISVRTLHRLFSTADETVGAVIRERRLSRCRADLARGTHESVTAIAFRWGFRDMSHFSRVFRRRYGASASEVQTAARALAGG